MTREEAIEIVKTQYSHDAVMTTALGMLIPELQESDDERIRKALINGMKYLRNRRKTLFYDLPINDVIAWLEKQKEQKPTEWSEEDEEMVRFYENDYDNNFGNMPMCDVIENRIKFKGWLLNKLKSLRPQPHWKPSECQMDSLREIADSLPKGSNLKYLEEVIYALGQQKDDCFSWKPSEEQPEVDLEKFISDFIDKKDSENQGKWCEEDILDAMRRSFYLGFNARKV